MKFKRQPASHHVECYVKESRLLNYVEVETDSGVVVEVAKMKLIAMPYLGFRPGTTQAVFHKNPLDSLNDAVDNLFVAERLDLANHTQGVVHYVRRPFRVLHHFATLAQAERATGIQKSKIRQVCHGADADTTTEGNFFCYAEYFDEVVACFGPPVNAL
jgi:hypothetical protein